LRLRGGVSLYDKGALNCPFGQAERTKPFLRRDGQGVMPRIKNTLYNNDMGNVNGTPVS